MFKKKTESIEPPPIQESKPIEPNPLQEQVNQLSLELIKRDTALALWEIKNALDLTNKTLKDFIRLYALSKDIEIEDKDKDDK